MGNEADKGIHWSFWLICVFALLWNVGGAINYLMQTNSRISGVRPYILRKRSKHRHPIIKNSKS
jgi:hypothetical protein